MCANYTPVARASRLLEFFGVGSSADGPGADVFPMGLAPFIRLAPSGTEPEGLSRFLDRGIFRFVPEFAAKLDWARKTYNARSETVDTKATYRHAWAAGHRCIIPAESIYEPNYESGKAVRWRISRGDGAPMGIAGIFRSWTNEHNEVVFGMAMLTMNADNHPIMRRFHAPGHEKRMVVTMEPQQFDCWLSCSVSDAQEYCKQWNGLLVGEPAPLPGRTPAKKALKYQSPKLSAPGQHPTGDLF